MVSNLLRYWECRPGARATADGAPGGRPRSYPGGRPTATTSSGASLSSSTAEIEADLAPVQLQPRLERPSRSGREPLEHRALAVAEQRLGGARRDPLAGDHLP